CPPTAFREGLSDRTTACASSVNLLAAPRRGDIFVPPVFLNSSLARADIVERNLQDRGRTELVDVPKDRVRRRHIGETQEQRERVAIDRIVELTMGTQRLQFRAEDERRSLAAPKIAIVKRLLAETVARERKPTFCAIPKRQREHADGFLKRRRHAPGGETFEQSFGIGGPAPIDLGLRLESPAQRQVIVDFA